MEQMIQVMGKRLGEPPYRTSMGVGPDKWSEWLGDDFADADEVESTDSYSLHVFYGNGNGRPQNEPYIANKDQGPRQFFGHIFFARKDEKANAWVDVTADDVFKVEGWFRRAKGLQNAS